jgi:hypothetical protein
LVPLWHKIGEDQLYLLPRFDHIVCPHAAVFALLEGIIQGVQHSPWDTGLPLHSAGLVSDTRRIYVPIDSYTAKVFGVQLLSALSVLVDDRKDTMLTIGYQRSWDRPSLQVLGELLKKHPHRIRLLRKPNHAERVEAYLRHDWTFVPSLRDNAGLAVHESLCSRKPVATFGIQPFRAIATEHCTHFIPCEQKTNWFGAAEAIPNMAVLLDQLRLLANEPAVMQTLASNSWPWLATSRALNCENWQRIWDLA